LHQGINENDEKGNIVYEFQEDDEFQKENIDDGKF